MIEDNVVYTCDQCGHEVPDDGIVDDGDLCPKCGQGKLEYTYEDEVEDE